MPNTGYPTPDAQEGDVTFGCIPIFVPNNPEFAAVFAAAVYGLYGQMSKEWFWREQGTLSPELAAYYSSLGLGATEAYAECSETMSCDDVADCIDNDAGVLASLLARLNASGTLNNTGTNIAPVNVMTSEGGSENLLPAGYACDDGQAMATARGLVNLFHRGTVELLDEIELLTNLPEFATSIADNVEIVSWFSTLAESATWLQDQLIEFYEASWSDDTEDNLSCAIYCKIMADCDLSWQDIIDAYEESLGAITPPESADNPQDVVDWLVSLEFTVATSTVAAFHWFIVNALRFSTPILGLLGLRSLEEQIAATQGQYDSSYTNCDECYEPVTKAYWRIYQDAAVAQGEFEAQATFGTYETGGWRSNTANPTVLRVGIPDLGTTWSIYGLAFEFQARGFTSLSTDLANFACWAGANYTSTLLGTPYTAANFTAASDVNDNRVGWVAAPTGIAGVRSVRMQLQTAGVYAAGTNFVKATKILVVGACGAGDSMPIGAEYYTDTLPATVQELFPDYVAP